MFLLKFNLFAASNILSGYVCKIGRLALLCACGVKKPRRFDHRAVLVDRRMIVVEVFLSLGIFKRGDRSRFFTNLHFPGKKNHHQRAILMLFSDSGCARSYCTVFCTFSTAAFNATFCTRTLYIGRSSTNGTFGLV